MKNSISKEIKSRPSQLVRLVPLQNKICINQQNHIHIISIEEICYLQSDGNYTTIVLRNEERILASVTMGKYCPLLERHGFLRTHSSFIINPRFLTSILKDEGFSVILNGKYTLPTSRRRKSVLVDFISQFNIN